MSSKISLPPTTSAPASLASCALAPSVTTKTFLVFPVPFGNTNAPRNCWSAWRGSTPNLNATSTAASNLTLLVSFTNATASSIE